MFLAFFSSLNKILTKFYLFRKTEDKTYFGEFAMLSHFRRKHRARTKFSFFSFLRCQKSAAATSSKRNRYNSNLIAHGGTLLKKARGNDFTYKEVSPLMLHLKIGGFSTCLRECRLFQLASVKLEMKMIVSLWLHCKEATKKSLAQ